MSDGQPQDSLLDAAAEQQLAAHGSLPGYQAEKLNELLDQCAFRHAVVILRDQCKMTFQNIGDYLSNISGRGATPWLISKIYTSSVMWLRGEKSELITHRHKDKYLMRWLDGILVSKETYQFVPKRNRKTERLAREWLEKTNLTR